MIFKVDFFFEKNLLIQSDVVFDLESNDVNFSSLAPSDGQKKIIYNFFYKLSSFVIKTRIVRKRAYLQGVCPIRTRPIRTRNALIG